MPPQWMWHCDKELDVWFERVKEEREEKYGRGAGDKDSDGSSSVQNELARDRR